MGPAIGADAVPAARLRGSRARAFVGTARALPAAVRGAQHAGRRAIDAGPDVSPIAPANAAACAQTARRHDPEELAAAPALGVDDGRARARALPTADRGSRAARRRRGHTRGVLQW